MPRDLSTLAPPPLNGRTCTECGAQIPPGFGSCDELFMFILTPLSQRGQDSPEAFRLARLFVDTFGMQHPARSGKSPKSYAAHLTGLACGVEYNCSRWLYADLQKWLNRPAAQSGLRRPVDLPSRGTLTVRFIYDAPDQAEADRRIPVWARDVWEAYAPQHELSRSWIRAASKR
jgi:hypothetical protein